MKTKDEIIRDVSVSLNDRHFGESEIVALKRAIEITSLEVLKEASKKATAHVERDGFDGTYDAVVNRKSITEIVCFKP